MNDQPRKALITGASSGLGTEFSRQLAAACDEIILTGRNEDALEQLANELQQQGVKIRVVAADLSTTIGTAQLVETIRQQGPLDYLVNNAGFTTMGPFLEQHPASQQAMVSLHITATLQLTLAALGGMRENRRGHIINVSSLGALAPMAGVAVYCGTKSFLNTFSASLQQEVQELGIVVQCLCPGYTRTGFHDTAYFEGFDPGTIPDQYWMEAGEVVAQSLAYLDREDRQVVFVPGAGNRAMAAKAMQYQLDLGFGD